MPEVSDEMWDLLNGLCERRLTPAQSARLQELVLSSPDARWQYLTYLNLHGTLYWDAAGGLAISRLPVAAAAAQDAPLLAAEPVPTPGSGRHRVAALLGSLAGLLAIAMIGLIWWQSPTNEIAQNDDPVDQAAEGTSPDADSIAGAHGPRRPVQLSPRRQDGLTEPGSRPGDVPATIGANRDHDGNPDLPSAVRSPVALINQEVQRGWSAAAITPSERADDASWVRRVYLDLAGHIPSAEEAKRFLADRRDDKREKLVDQLLNDPAFVRQMTTQWMNLLVGRSSPPQVNRPALAKFLRTSFAENHGWDEIVNDLVSAEGRSDENGAANFLIAHLNNQAVPATAITARLFLGVQVQCTQCHNHPSGLAKQTDFWEFNSFFHQTEAVTLVERDPTTGLVKSQVAELVSQPTGGATFFEAPNGVMKAVYPRYHGKEVPADPDHNRRQELARLMVEEDGPQLSKAFVNRTWQHFFGYGFTRQIDDMGPHIEPSHPVLLTGLSAAFRHSGYDIKQLARWICLSEPYQLSSRFNESNKIDDPDRGETALFSHVYAQPMTVEQLYDSFLVATKAHQHGVTDWTAAESQRQAWLQQFIISFQTDENDEAVTFEGTVSGMLALMNGPLIEKALEPNSGTYLSEVLRTSDGETEKIEQLCLAALSRKPTSRELTAMRKLVHRPAADNPQTGIEGYQDLFWALLNSNEFSVVY